MLSCSATLPAAQVNTTLHAITVRHSLSLLQMFEWEGIGLKKLTTMQQRIKLYLSHPGGHLKLMDFQVVPFSKVYAVAHITDRLRLEMHQEAVNLKGAQVWKVVRGIDFMRNSMCSATAWHAQCNFPARPTKHSAAVQCVSIRARALDGAGHCLLAVCAQVVMHN